MLKSNISGEEVKDSCWCNQRFTSVSVQNLYKSKINSDVCHMYVGQKFRLENVKNLRPTLIEMM